MGGCNWNCELTQYLSNTCQVHFIFAIHGCKCSFKKNPYPLMNGWPQLLLYIKKHCTLKKHCSLKLNAVTFKKIFIRNKYLGSQPFLMSCYFTGIFIHLPVIVAVCYFDLHKLIGWDPANIYLFKINTRNTRKSYKIYPKLTTNTTESRSDVAAVKCFYFWL